AGGRVRLATRPGVRGRRAPPAPPAAPSDRRRTAPPLTAGYTPSPPARAPPAANRLPAPRPHRRRPRLGPPAHGPPCGGAAGRRGRSEPFGYVRVRVDGDEGGVNRCALGVLADGAGPRHQRPPPRRPPGLGGPPRRAAAARGARSVGAASISSTGAPSPRRRG